MAFPPSPVLSECDTLADMVDLDAYLAAQGPLSNFPTPPLKAGVAVSVHVEEFDVEKELYEDPRNDHYLHATHFAHAVGSISHHDIETIEFMLLRTDLPVEVVALSYNILMHFVDSSNHSEAYAPLTPSDLQTVSALQIAVCYAYDNAPKTDWWSEYVCDRMRRASNINAYILHMLQTLDWGLHRLSTSDALRSAMATLAAPPEQRALLSPLKLLVDDGSNNFPTPEATPPCSGMDSTDHYFLPLL